MALRVYSEETFKPLLKRLISGVSGADLHEVVGLAVEHMASPNGASPAQIGAFLTALKVTGQDMTADALSAATQAMSKHAIDVSVETPDAFVVDIVGTGGDGHDTFNVSTSAAIVAAGAGARVVKHGNKASTSSSGSADVLRALGCELAAPVEGHTLPDIPFTFLLASHYHPAMALIAPHRKSLPFRTLFNVLGPLLNPSHPKGMLLGVADPSLGPQFALTLRGLGVQRGMVVCGFENLDELSIAGPSRVWSFEESGAITEDVLDPQQFGLITHSLALVKGGSPGMNASILRGILTPGVVPPCEARVAQAIEDFIILNAAALLVVAGLASSFPEGAAMARNSIVSGRALEALELFRRSELELFKLRNFS